MAKLLSACLVALLCAISLTAAQNCPATPANYYLNRNCTSPILAMATYCTCIGATLNAVTGQCLVLSRPTCALTQTCLASFFRVLNKDGETTVCDVAFKVQLTALAAGNPYAGSNADKSCRNSVCLIVNSTNPTGGCPSDLSDQLCTSPYAYHAELKLEGDFSRFFANAALLSGLKTAVGADLARVLGFIIRVLGLSQGSLVVDFEADVAATNPTLLANLASASTNTAWLTNTKSAIVAAGGDPNAIQVAGFTQLAPSSQLPRTLASSASSVLLQAALAVAAIIALVA